MSLGPLMLDIAGVQLTTEDREILRHPLVGGVILFTRNYESPEQLMALTSAIHQIRHPELLIAVDHEGGRVQRFRSGFTRLPSARAIGKLFEKSTADGKRAAEQLGWLMAAELRAAGVDFSFAPVLDLERGISDVIGDRGFGADPDIVAEVAHSYMIGMHNAGMAAVGKHFPGHGNVKEDSHIAIPVDDRRYEDIFFDDIVPFQRMIHYGLDAVMPAHVIYKQVDQQPAGFSEIWINQILRKRLGFQGVVFSDDLNMAAAHVAGTFTDRAKLALDAGCDMALACNNRAGALEILDQMGQFSNPAAQLRYARMHGRKASSTEVLTKTARWQNAVTLAGELSNELKPA
ncbi:MAG: beta-N-acetylhexosaminidase [Gammaproteobacteria bacterium]|nr:beta-N-acetylhexosaminidase [Gammaproteobacteria bacterium]